MLPAGDLLPHVICSPPVFAGGGEHEADQHDDTRRVGDGKQAEEKLALLVQARAAMGLEFKSLAEEVMARYGDRVEALRETPRLTLTFSLADWAAGDWRIPRFVRER